MQMADAKPGNLDPSGDDPVDSVPLPLGSRPFWVALDKQNRYAYVSDEDPVGDPAHPMGAIYVVDIDPTSPTFHQLVRTIEVAAPFGLRHLIVSDDGKRLYVAAPNRDGYDKPAQAHSTVRYVVNIDEADRPRDPALGNPRKFGEVIAEIDTGQETYGLQTTGDPHRILFTNRFDDAEGLGFIEVTSDDPLAFQATTRTIGLTLGSTGDTFDVNSAISALVLPADAFKDVIGSHPEYVFVAGFNRFIQGDPSHDPDAFERGRRGDAVARRQQRRDHPRRPARRRRPCRSRSAARQPRVRSRLQLPVRGLPRRHRKGVGDGAVLVYNLVNLIGQVEYLIDHPDLTSRMQKYPIEELYFDQILPQQEDLQLFNAAIDIKADYRIIQANYNAGRFTFGIPYLMDGHGNYLLDAGGNKIPSPNGPFATGGTAQGLSAHPTEVAPGPRVWNQFDLGRNIGLADRHDLGVADLLAEISKPQDCGDQAFNSEVQLDSAS